MLSSPIMTAEFPASTYTLATSSKPTNQISSITIFLHQLQLSNINENKPTRFKNILVLQRIIFPLDFEALANSF